MKGFRSFFFIIAVIYSTIFLGPLTVVLAYLTRKGDMPHLVARAWGNVNLWAAGVKVHVRGLENIDPKASYVYAANHQSWFDIFAILGRLPVQFRWLAKEELFKFPFLGAAMAAIGYVPIDRTDRRKAFASIDQAARKVRGGTSIVIFPEGTRSPNGVLQDFKKGGFALAMKSQRPMVPISICHSHRIMPKSEGLKIQPGEIEMVIGKPIPTKGLETRDRSFLMSALREAIRENLPVSEGGRRPDRDVSLLCTPFAT